jgi:anti-sigma-K factor RskA
VEAHTPLRTYGLPAADHTPNAEELAGLYAFGVLEGAELGRFERHLAGCGRCAEIVDGDVAMVGAISLTVPEVEAAPDFKARLLARAAAEIEAGTARVEQPPRVERSARVVPLVARRRTTASLAWLLPLAAILLAVIGGSILLSRQLATAQVVATAALENTAGQGRAEVLVRRSGEGVIQLSGFDDLGNGRVYQAWVIRPGQPPQATGATARGNGTLTLDGDVRGAKVAVTLEPGPGATAPSQAPFVIGDAPA